MCGERGGDGNRAGGMIATRPTHGRGVGGYWCLITITRARVSPPGGSSDPWAHLRIESLSLGPWPHPTSKENIPIPSRMEPAVEHSKTMSTAEYLLLVQRLAVTLGWAQLEPRLTILYPIRCWWIALTVVTIVNQSQQGLEHQRNVAWHCQTLSKKSLTIQTEAR